MNLTSPKHILESAAIGARPYLHQGRTGEISPADSLLIQSWKENFANNPELWSIILKTANEHAVYYSHGGHGHGNTLWWRCFQEAVREQSTGQSLERWDRRYPQVEGSILPDLTVCNRPLPVADRR